MRLQMQMHMHPHSHLHSHLRKRMRTHTHTHIHTHIHTHTHTHAHTHTCVTHIQVESDQWWLHFKSKPGGKEREIAKWRARLKRFEAIAANSSAEGEKANATKLATQVSGLLQDVLRGIVGGGRLGGGGAVGQR